MVGPSRNPAQQTQWAPRAAGIVACGVAGLAMAVLCLVGVTDAPGRVLTGLAAIGLLVFAAFSWRARPRLAVTAPGLVVRGWFGSRLVERGHITLVRITEFRRIGRKVRLLEIDTDDGRLLVFSRWDLGTDPVQVLDVLTAEGYAGPRTG